ncbi:P-loop containing nucleoside triphosphate hydrolase protein [Pseudomassariella vexata]|uniref:p-loop containing nucleoside triphosphate hydrolase protein n=1 Tax=Pseudomassariella vexata TaxID=1141098 RepID=A0A1Y2DXT9_9PEZI|nr:P-loop containing nucleoside triphosphate hydrolase protein [Pseudomassariella vexata]ORY64120.1 P-loop containing nucleoside triphosphate hydrolase protein [Pseudomassariella vexata]
MAFQTAALPSIAAVTTDLWPSMANTLMMPFRGAWLPPTPKHSSTCAPKLELSEQSRRQQSSPTQANAHPKFELPEFLRDAAYDGALMPRHVPSVFNIHRSISTMSSGALLASNPIVRRLNAQRLALRPLSTLTATRTPLSSSSFPMTIVPQRRFSQNGGLSRNLLAHMEESANRNPSSATAQNAFYQALLKANMPAIIIERYRSGRFATNAAADEVYQKALSQLAPPGAQGIDTTEDNLPSDLTPTQLQAVKQALAARARGGNLAVAKGTSGGTAGSGAPLHVVVDETMGSALFRWVKFILWFCLFTYLSLVIITMLVEGMSVLKRPGAKVDSEAKSESQKARFSDVHGCDEAKEELQEMVDFLRNPEKFSTLGGKLPKGILLVGPPGTGKTLLARAVAGEAGVPFFYMSGSEFDEVYVGVGAKRVRELFAAAKAKSPSIVFIDELDAIGGRRNARDAAYVKQTLNQLLTELDGFEQNSGVIIIGATNFPQLLDKALTRPGRFDRHVNVDLPDVRGRLAILQHHAKKIKADKDVDFKAIAMSTGGLSGAELENIVNQAAVHASRAKAKWVGLKDFDWAKDKVIMGAERKTMVITPEEKEMTAYHEAGHALVQLLSENAGSQLYKVTVLARGGTLGHTAYLPQMDKYSWSKLNYRTSIDTALGGKLAEEIVYGVDNVTSGASAVNQITWRKSKHCS